MSNSNKVQRIASSALAGLLVLGTTVMVPALAAPPKGMEKCYGIAKAHMNDCKAADHSCRGKATRSGDPESFVVVPKGECHKIVHGSRTPHKA